MERKRGADSSQHVMSTCVSNSLIAFGVLLLLNGLSSIGICIWSILEASINEFDRCLYGDYYDYDDYYYYYYNFCLGVVFTFSSQGIWSGCFATIAGCLSIDFGVNPDKKLGSTTTGINTFATVLSSFMIGLETCGLIYSYSYTLITLHCALVGLASGQFIFGLVLSILSCVGKGCCCGQSQVLYTQNRNNVIPIVGVGRDNPAYIEQYPYSSQQALVSLLARQPTQIPQSVPLYTTLEQTRPQTGVLLAENPPPNYNPDVPLLRQDTLLAGASQQTFSQDFQNPEEAYLRIQKTQAYDMRSHQDMAQETEGVKRPEPMIHAPETTAQNERETASVPEATQVSPDGPKHSDAGPIVDANGNTEDSDRTEDTPPEANEVEFQPDGSSNSENGRTEQEPQTEENRLDINTDEAQEEE